MHVYTALVKIVMLISFLWVPSHIGSYANSEVVGIVVKAALNVALGIHVVYTIRENGGLVKKHIM